MVVSQNETQGERGYARGLALWEVSQIFPGRGPGMDTEEVQQRPTMLNSALKYESMGLSVIPIKPDKKPFVPWTPYQTRRATSEEIKDWWEKYPDANIGIVTGPISGVWVIDCDNEEAYQKIQGLLSDNFITCIAKTPRGYHIYLVYSKERQISNGAGILPGVDIRGGGGYAIAPPSVNGTGKGYAWLDGLSIDEVNPAPAPPAIFSIINNAFNKDKGEKKEGHTESHQVTGSHNFLNEGRRDDDLFHTANCLIKGGMEQETASYVLDILSRSCKPPFSQSEAQIKIQSALARSERRERNIAEEVRNFLEVTTGHFLVTDVYTESQLVTKQERHAVIVELSRLCDAGIIERYGTKRGSYRVIENKCEAMDFQNVKTDTLDLRLPFRIHEYVTFYPGNLIIIAGEPNAGKTAFLINVIRLNMHLHEIHYFNSEMGGAEFHKRLSKIEDISMKDWRFKAWERSDNFQDVVKPGPGKLNIIDFLEVHDEFYKIGGTLAEIHRKLKGALAIVAIQKNKGTDTGLGGFRTLEKPRLALAMEPGKLKIVKAKNWKTTENPNGLVIGFKLSQGCRFFTDKEWKKEQ